MSVLDKQAFKEKYTNASTGIFKTGQSRGIGSDDLRTFTEDTADSFSDAVEWKKFCIAATTTTLPAYTASAGGTILTGNANGALSAQDGVTLTVNQDLLVKNESTTKYNGIYRLTQLGDASNPYILTRREDANTGEKIQNAIVPVQQGTNNAGTIWKQTTSSTITIDTTGIAFTKIPNNYIQSLETTVGGTTDPPVSYLVGAYQQVTTINSAAVLTGNASPVNVTPTPDSGLVIVPIAFFVHLDYNSAAYATNTTFRFEINGVGVTNVNSTTLPGTADRFRTMLPIEYDTTTDLKAQPVKFKVQGGNPTAGNSPLYVTCIYRIVPTSNVA